MKKVVIISSSLRTNSSSKALALKVKEGIEVNNNEVKFIDLKDFNLKLCIGCLACQTSGKCVIDDDVKKILDDVSNADILVFASPIYYYSITGQLKTLLDRLNPLYVRDNKFKEVYFITTCADEEIGAIQKPITTIEGWIECFDDVKFVNTFAGLGVNSFKDLENTDYLEKAYEFGKAIK